MLPARDRRRLHRRRRRGKVQLQLVAYHRRFLPINPSSFPASKLLPRARRPEPEQRDKKRLASSKEATATVTATPATTVADLATAVPTVPSTTGAGAAAAGGFDMLGQELADFQQMFVRNNGYQQ